MGAIETQYTGIIRTLPYGPKAESEALRRAYRKMLAGLHRLNRYDNASVLIGMTAQPRYEVLHCYLLVESRIIGRANIVEYVTDAPPIPCWDGTRRVHKIWARLSAPFELAPDLIERRGFQGFRYTETLW